MKLTKLQLEGYRNISSLTLDPCDAINVLYGDNAQGKTNLIEAVWLFTGNTSFRGAKTPEMIQFGKEQCKLYIEFLDNQRPQRAEIQIGTKKEIRLNGVNVLTAPQLCGNFYAVVFSPAHLSFIKDGPKNRRKFIDIALSQITPQYEGYLQTYQQILEQRNALLRDGGRYQNLEENIEVWDLQLAKAGTILSIYRNDYVAKLNRITKEIYSGLSKRQEEFSVSYVSTVFEDLRAVTSYKEEQYNIYMQKLRESFATDFRYGHTTAGIHRDDLEVCINGRPARIYGSQGQQRSAVIALKLGEAQLLKKVTGEKPVMLLDDVMSELDEKRQDYILNHLKDMQVFITCCDVGNTLRMKSGRIFEIKDGAVVRQAEMRAEEYGQ